MKKDRKKRLLRIARRARERREARHPVVHGTLSMSANGFGFVTLPPGDGGVPQEDVFIPPQFIRDAVDGDVVKVELLPPREEFGDERKGPAGKIVGIIRRERQEFVGELVAGRKVRPFNRKLPEEVELSGGRIGGKRGDWVKVRLLDCEDGVWRGSIKKVLGRAGIISADLDAVMEEYQLCPRYGDAFDAEAAAIVPREIPREDRTAELTVTIDPFDAKDFDDALSILPGTDDGTLIVGVHISDVAAYIAPGGIFDKEAAKRGFSCYLPGRTLPMLPPALTAKISLQQHQESLAHSVYLTVEKSSGKVLAMRRIHTKIRVDHRLNYEEVQTFFDRGTAPEQWSGPLKNVLRQMLEITRAMRRYRKETEEFIDLALPEIRVLCDEKSNVLQGLSRKVSRESEAVVEECMLAANSAVGTELGEKGIAGLYRVHPAPEADKIAEFSDMMTGTFGIVPGDLTERKAVNRFISQLPDTPRKPVILNLLLRSMPRAFYQEKPALHFGLGKGRYSHFTSPIRRYTDLTVHQQLWEYDLKQRTRTSGVMAKIAERCSELEENSDAAYFAASDRLKLRYLQELLEKGGENFYEGVIAKVTSAGLQVDIFDLGLYGFVPRDLPGGVSRHGYGFRRNSQDAACKPGDFIFLRLHTIDFARGSAVFVPAK
ncbi:MAG: VacB/RNase II family 3'-5' exoribonuclease [Lentisphaeria bacterium]|nr:VacB/RNase II family 3'-5' exoribonuclease [Lentisphaeria bacterium]